MTKHPQSQKIKNITTELNRLRTQQVVIERKLSQQTKSERRARTRTLIQMGGLISMIGLADICDITEGDDLQLDIVSRDKAATLLGMLVTLIEQLPPALSSLDLETFKQKGINMLKRHEAKKYRNLS
jgi:hypothetical protein